MKKTDYTLIKKALCDRINGLSDKDMKSFISKFDIDLRVWYYVDFPEGRADWWASDYELKDIKKRYGDVKFEKVPFQKTIFSL